MKIIKEIEAGRIIGHNVTLEEVNSFIREHCKNKVTEIFIADNKTEYELLLEGIIIMGNQTHKPSRAKILEEFWQATLNAEVLSRQNFGQFAALVEREIKICGGKLAHLECSGTA